MSKESNQTNRLKRVIAAHDLSGFGKASLAIAIPVLSAMGLYVAPLTTAVLSTITGVFEGFEIVNLTEFTQKTINHWEKLKLKFDYLYSGFLADVKAVDIIIETAEKFPECMVIVDTVMGDDGKLYPTMTEEMVVSMRRLIGYAHIITPNLTEAQFLLGEKVGVVTENDVRKYLVELAKMGPKQIAITSCNYNGNVAIGIYDNGKIDFIDSPQIPVSPHGTGDLFASVLIGELANGKNFYDATKMSRDFVNDAILKTLELGIDFRDGVAFEKILYKLTDVVKDREN